jgi:hypothetical protein
LIFLIRSIAHCRRDACATKNSDEALFGGANPFAAVFSTLREASGAKAGFIPGFAVFLSSAAEAGSFPSCAKISLAFAKSGSGKSGNCGDCEGGECLAHDAYPFASHSRI